MAKRRPENFDIASAVRSKSFTPSARDVDAMLDLLDTADEDTARSVENALSAPASPVDAAARKILERLPSSVRPARGILTKILGRIAREKQNPELGSALIALLDDADLKTRRNAIAALGGLNLPGVEDALLNRWETETSPPHRKSIVQSLGKIGGPKSLLALENFKPDGGDIIAEAAEQSRLMISRTSSRAEESGIDGSATFAGAVRMVAYCRPGLDAMLAKELGSSRSPRTIGPGAVEFDLRGPLNSVFSARTFHTLAFPLPPLKGLDEESIVSALTGADALRVFKTWTRGLIRYRFEWADEGHRRSLAWSCAQSVSKKNPELINDPSESTWEAVVRREKNVARMELVPKRLRDPRFEYRVKDVPAASHPPLAAALAKIAGARNDDVAWDPFAGCGTELIERALAGPFRELHGTDVSAQAVDAARENAGAAKVAGLKFSVADCIRHEPPKLTLILTNPPMGRRVLRGTVEKTLKKFLARVPSLLVEGGRMVWISPTPERHAAQAGRSGLALTFNQNVDMGGFKAQIQRYEKR